MLNFGSCNQSVRPLLLQQLSVHIFTKTTNWASFVEKETRRWLGRGVAKWLATDFFANLPIVWSQPLCNHLVLALHASRVTSQGYTSVVEGAGYNVQGSIRWCPSGLKDMLSCPPGCALGLTCANGWARKFCLIQTFTLKPNPPPLSPFLCRSTCWSSYWLRR